MKKAPNGHKFVFAQRGSAPGRGFVDQFADLNNLADTVADATRDVLVEHDGRLSIVREGKCVHASIEDLCALIEERVEVQKLVERNGSAELVYSPLQLNHNQVRALLTADNLKSGSLPARVWKA